jgi:5-methylcytosine-specific restriction protein A
MTTYLITWNPKRWPWDMEDQLSQLKRQGFVDSRWSCGRTKRINAGDRLFLLRQGIEPRGIMGAGVATSSPYLDKHWDDTRDDEALYVRMRFDSLMEPEGDGVLPLSRLRDGALGTVNWRTQSSGISVSPAAAAMLERQWHDFLEERGQSPSSLADEVCTPSQYFEGASRTIAVNAYERDPRARKACIDHYGCTCSVCGFDFAVVYGPLGRGYIHVHHVVPLSAIGKTYVIDPVKDLRPVCPNCHAMLHKPTEILSVAELKRLLRR